MFKIRIARLDGKPGFHIDLIELLSDISSMNEIDDSQIAILMEAARTKEVPKRLARVDLSKAL